MAQATVFAADLSTVMSTVMSTGALHFLSKFRLKRGVTVEALLPRTAKEKAKEEGGQLFHIHGTRSYRSGADVCGVCPALQERARQSALS